MSVVLIVGAGFSLDANARIAAANRRYSRGYPLIGDLGTACFDSTYDLAAGVEVAFDEALSRKDHEPLTRLVDAIQNADYYAGSEAARASTSLYHTLIVRFRPLTFLSFNYDGLLELILHEKKLWTPVDGFGIPCRADRDRSYVGASQPPTESAIRVLHLHGSVYLYPIEIEFYDPSDKSDSKTQWFRLTATQEVQFDPDSLTNCFIPFAGGAHGRLTYKLPSERIIVPSPDKTTALTDRFSQAVYAQATLSLAEAEGCIAIGYRFADCDSASFLPLLRAASRGRAESFGVVAPDARETASRIRPHLRRVRMSVFEGTLRQWVEADFVLHDVP